MNWKYSVDEKAALLNGQNILRNTGLIGQMLHGEVTGKYKASLTDHKS